LAVDLINRRAVNMKPLLTGCYGLDDVQKAFELAGDRSRSMKVQLSF
jgi:L-idonate 5-dehydrogenase